MTPAANAPPPTSIGTSRRRCNTQCALMVEGVVPAEACEAVASRFTARRGSTGELALALWQRKMKTEGEAWIMPAATPGDSAKLNAEPCHRGAWGKQCLLPLAPGAAPRRPSQVNFGELERRFREIRDRLDTVAKVEDAKAGFVAMAVPADDCGLDSLSTTTGSPSSRSECSEAAADVGDVADFEGGELSLLPRRCDVGAGAHGAESTQAGVRVVIFAWWGKEDARAEEDEEEEDEERSDEQPFLEWLYDCFVGSEAKA